MTACGRSSGARCPHSSITASRAPGIPAAISSLRASGVAASSRPQTTSVGAAIAGSALLFGLGHLPTIVAYGGALTGDVIVWTLAGNGIFGAVAGVLFRRHGLEAAMLAHGLAHVVAFVA